MTEPCYCPTCGRKCATVRFGNGPATPLCLHCTPPGWTLVDEMDDGDELDDALAAELRALLGES